MKKRMIFLLILSLTALALPAQCFGPPSDKGPMSLVEALHLKKDRIMQIYQLMGKHKVAHDQAMYQLVESMMRLENDLMSPQIDMKRVEQEKNNVERLHAKVIDVRIENSLALNKLLTPQELEQLKQLRKKNKRPAPPPPPKQPKS